MDLYMCRRAMASHRQTTMKNQLSFPKCNFCVHTQHTSTRLHYPKLPLKKLDCYHMPDQEKKISHLHFELKRSQQDSSGWLQGCALQRNQEFFANRYLSNGATSRDQPTSLERRLVWASDCMVPQQQHAANGPGLLQQLARPKRNCRHSKTFRHRRYCMCLIGFYFRLELVLWIIFPVTTLACLLVQIHLKGIQPAHHDVHDMDGKWNN